MLAWLLRLLRLGGTTTTPAEPVVVCGTFRVADEVAGAFAVADPVAGTFRVADEVRGTFRLRDCEECC